MIVAANLGPLELTGSYGFHDLITVALSRKWEDTKHRFESKCVER